MWEMPNKKANHNIMFQFVLLVMVVHKFLILFWVFGNKGCIGGGVLGEWDTPRGVGWAVTASLGRIPL